MTPRLGPRSRFAALVLALLAGLIVVLLVYAIISSATQTSEIRDTQMEGTPLGKKLAASSDRILDCTEPTGKCFKQNQRRTAAVVGEVGAGNILAIVCALEVPDAVPFEQALDQVTACVADELKKP